MELWIRSQNKEILIKCEKILVEKGKDSFALLNYIDIKNWFRLGNYKTKERALEVLDEIQRTIAKTLDCIIEQSDNCIVGCNTLVLYQMPKE